MILYPAIDIKEGRCVRLVQGDPARQTVYFEDPLEAASHWATQGAEWLHVVNLDGALSGAKPDRELLKGLTGLGRPYQLGGGLRDRASIELAFELGAARVVLGTAAVETPELLRWALQAFGPPRVVLALDADLVGRVRTRGWRQASPLTAARLARETYSWGVRRAIHTAVDRDGTLDGPDLEGLKRLQREVPLAWIAAGGIGRLEDLLDLAALGVEGAVLGQALYSGRVGLAQAQRELNRVV